MQRRGFLKGLLTGVAAVVGGAKLAQAADVVPMKCVPLRAPNEATWVSLTDAGKDVFTGAISNNRFIVPEGVTTLRVSCYGGGGGGSSGGHGMLEIRDVPIRVNPGDSVVVTIGA